jgi:hypothetical protein
MMTSHSNELQRSCIACCPEASFWKEEIKDEHHFLMENKTWTIVQLPVERKAIKCKWVLDYKPGYKNVDSRYKAR